mmetsp:Transcript_20842/g.60671  ORF Transcript_20842/g.60671 Transcript_20842/m.60671 type:complete len:318 (-) Transcript_20842:368-1321(-)
MTIQRAMALSARTAVRMAANATATPPPLKMMMMSSMSSMSSVSSSSFGRRRQVHSTSASWKQGGGGEPVEAVEAVEAAAAADTASAYQKEKAEAERRPGPDDGDDQQPSSSSSSSSPPSPVPEWQNPRHHNDPQLQKVFFEDFDDKEKKGEEPQISPLPPFSDPDTTDTNKVSVPRREVQDIADAIVGMNMLEVKELVDRIGEHFGLEDKPMTMFGGGGGGGGGGGNLAAGGGGDAAAEEEEKEKKTSFDLKLTGYDKKAKIKVIKEVRACVAGLGLKEAKEMVEGAPKVIMKGIKMEQAEELKAKLEEIGATVEIV